MTAYNIACTFGAKGSFSSRFARTQFMVPQVFQAGMSFAYTSIMLQHPIGAHKVFVDDLEWSANTGLKCDPEWVGSDKVNAGVLWDAGAQTLYQNATGLIKAWADVDAWRITRTYAELIKEQWDADLIDERNLAYLAWAKGVNLWESWWSIEFKRQWVRNQWTYKYHRGSLLGLKEFVNAVGGKLKRATVPPAKTFLQPNLTPDQRAAYVARFPQLRMRPYVARTQLPWLAYVGGHSYDRLGNKVKAKARFLNHMYPTIQDAGGRYTRTAYLYDHGSETKLTVRKIEHILTGESAGWGFTPGVSQYDEEVVLPIKDRVFYYIGQHGVKNKKKFLDGGAANGIFLDKKAALRTISISRSGLLPLTQGKAIYETIQPSNDLVTLLPDHVTETHPARYVDLRRRKLGLPRIFIPPPPSTSVIGAQGGMILERVPGTITILPGFDADTNAWQIATGFNVSPPRKALVNELIVGLKADGIWSHIDRLFVFAAENFNCGLIDLKSRSSATAVNSPTFTTDRGYSGNGSSSYLDTNYNPVTQGTNFVLSSAHISAWNVTDRAPADMIATGSYTWPNALDLWPYESSFAPTGVGFHIMSAIETSSIATSSSRGFILGQTDGATVQQIFRNGASIGSPPITYGYFGMINLPIYVLGRNNEGVIAGASTDQIAAVSYGGMLTSTQATAFYNRLRTYLSALGVP